MSEQRSGRRFPDLGSRVEEPLPQWEHELLVVDERKQRSESLRLTQQALHVDVDSWDLVGLAHWVHTGREIPQSGHDPAVSPDAARWTPGDDE